MIGLYREVQIALDTALYEDGVRSYWKRRKKTTGANPDEYIVYTIGGEERYAYADNSDQLSATNITLRYYHDINLTDSQAGRVEVDKRINQIIDAMRAGGFRYDGERLDAGPIDDAEYNAVVLEFYTGGDLNG